MLRHRTAEEHRQTDVDVVKWRRQTPKRSLFLCILPSL